MIFPSHEASHDIFLIMYYYYTICIPIHIDILKWSLESVFIGITMYYIHSNVTYSITILTIIHNTGIVIMSFGI